MSEILIAPPCSATLFLNNIFPFVSIVPPLLIAPPLIALLFINVLFIIIKCPLFSIAPPFFISAVLLSNIQSNNELEHNNKDWINDYMTPIYPNIFWIIENNNMERNQLFNYKFLGSFYNSMLLNIVIPSTVRKIGERAFYNTQLSTVTIPTNCEYSKNSFPIGCKINVK